MQKSKPSKLSNRNQQNFSVIVIGASAGGYNVIIELIKGISPVLNAAIIIVQHISSYSSVDFFVHHLQQHAPFKCKMAGNGEVLKTKTIYTVSPGYHLLLSGKKLIYGEGPDENGFKPSIDALFRSAGANYTNRVIGVILSGMRDDGAIGMAVIKKCGGVCIVQDPTEAEYPEMPVAVIDSIKPDHILPAENIPDVLLKESKRKRNEKIKVPEYLLKEAEIAEDVLTAIEDTDKIGDRVPFTCPSCGGPMWKIDADMTRYRCFTGHIFTEKAFVEKQNKRMQTTLWIAVRTMEERKTILRKISDDSKKKGRLRMANDYSQRAEKIDVHIDRLKELVKKIQKPDKSLSPL